MRIASILSLTVLLMIGGRIANANDNGHIGELPGWTFELVETAVNTLLFNVPNADLARYKIEITQVGKQIITVSFVGTDDSAHATSDLSVTQHAYQVVLTIPDLRVTYFGLIE